MLLVQASRGRDDALMVMTVLCDGKALLVTFTRSMKRSMLSGTWPLSHPAALLTSHELLGPCDHSSRTTDLARGFNLAATTFPHGCHQCCITPEARSEWSQMKQKHRQRTSMLCKQRTLLQA